MVLREISKEQLNFVKFTIIVMGLFPKALRKVFRSMWDNIYGVTQHWDDSVAVRNLFLTAEGGTTKVPTGLSYEKWDCTALFQATIFARSFAVPDSRGRLKTLSDLYIPRLRPGRFHQSVESPSGNNAETFALAIDQLRLLRNEICHSSNSIIDKATFDRYVQYAKEAFGALGVSTAVIDDIGNLNEMDFPTAQVLKLMRDRNDELREQNRLLEDNAVKKKEIAALQQYIENLYRTQDSSLFFDHVGWFCVIVHVLLCSYHLLYHANEESSRSRITSVIRARI